MKQISYKLDNDELQDAIDRAYEHSKHIRTNKLREINDNHIETLCAIQCERAKMTEK